MHAGKPIAVTLAIAFTLAASAASPQRAKALDVDPGDYAAAPPGTNLAIGYANFGWNNNFYTKTGDRVPNSSLNSQVGILRLVHYFDIGITIDPQIFIPFAALNNAKFGGVNYDSSLQFGDIIVASTFWFVNQPEEKRWLGFTPFFFFPTGGYRTSNAPFNVGENRYKQVLQVGFVQGFADKWTTDLIADTTFYENNNSYINGQTLKQDNSYQIQGWLRYAITPEWQVGGGYSGTFGGATELGGDNWIQATRQQQLRLITQYWPDPTLQFQAAATTDVWVEGQYKQVFGLRFKLLKVF